MSWPVMRTRFPALRHATLEHITHPEFATHQRCDDLLDHSVGKILLLRVPTHVLERQHGDGGPVRERKGGFHERNYLFAHEGFAHRHTIGTHRPSDILEGLLAHVLSVEGYLAGCVFMHTGRYADTPRLSPIALRY